MTTYFKEFKHIFDAIVEGKSIETLQNNNGTSIWVPITQSDVLYLISNKNEKPQHYRVKKPTIRIGNVDVPAPERKPLKKGQVYYVPFFHAIEYNIYTQEWSDDKMDMLSLNSGLIHLTKEAAEIHANAIIKLNTQTPT